MQNECWETRLQNTMLKIEISLEISSVWQPFKDLKVHPERENSSPAPTSAFLD